MEMQSKPGPNGTPGTFPSPSPGFARPSLPSSADRILGIIVRGIAVVLILVATILMGAAKQSKTVVTSTDDYTNTVYTDTVTIKSTYSPAYVYFIAANALSFFFSTVSFALTIINRSSFANLPLLYIIDQVTVVLLFTSNGAAAAITMALKKGNDEFGWAKICSLAGKFCSEVTAAIVLSMFAALAYVLLLLLSIIALHKRS
ncbi:CASP-like protein 1E1 [Asparagus officinalis]|uniref:CASP-like protein 1E1 n=1 Tax=Asparagus officinalis TaxID=4686 RepID=UPI00098E1C7C|nr:CASP-like protein 1E1 [Asparagus officinalis]